MRKLILILLVMGAALNAQAQRAGYTPVTDLAAFKQRFVAEAAKTTSVKSDFIQEKNLAMLDDKITSKGKFWFKKPDMLRMEYSKPFEYLMILNKDKVYIKDGQKENTISTRSNKMFKQINQVVLDCIQGTALSNPSFKSTVLENKTNYLVSLSPVGKELKDFFKTINIIIDKQNYDVNVIEMLENGGDSTIIRFTNREINAVIPDASFAIK